MTNFTFHTHIQKYIYILFYTTLTTVNELCNQLVTLNNRLPNQIYVGYISYV